MSETIYILMACVQYEGDSIIAAFRSKKEANELNDKCNAYCKENRGLRYTEHWDEAHPAKKYDRYLGEYTEVHECELQ